MGYLSKLLENCDCVLWYMKAVSCELQNMVFFATFALGRVISHDSEGDI